MMPRPSSDLDAPLQIKAPSSCADAPSCNPQQQVNDLASRRRESTTSHETPHLRRPGLARVQTQFPRRHDGLLQHSYSPQPHSASRRYSKEPPPTSYNWRPGPLMFPSNYSLQHHPVSSIPDVALREVLPLQRERSLSYAPKIQSPLGTEYYCGGTEHFFASATPGSPREAPAPHLNGLQCVVYLNSFQSYVTQYNVSDQQNRILYEWLIFCMICCCSHVTC